LRLFLDENLSEALLPDLLDLYPESEHVRTIGEGGATDRRVWNLARDRNALLVTRDQDFVRLSLALGAPPKIVWLNVGNRTNAEIIALLRASHSALQRLLDDPDTTVLELALRAG
jgi:predicted nuclease of predicted toxin-antitoxin system